MLNPDLKPGDRVVVLYMDDDTSPVPMGTAGTVMKSSVVFGEKHYMVNWDSGSKLNLIEGYDIWDLEDNVNRRLKKRIDEMTSSSSGGKYRVPLVLAPQIWDNDQMGAYTIPASQYMSADLAYDSYDDKMERSKKEISKEEKFARKKAKMAKEMFSQNDGDGNPINGYSPEGNKLPGTPKSVKKIAKLPKSEYEPVIKNSKKEKILMTKKRMVEDEGEKFKNLIKNGEIFKFFNMKFLQKYLIAVRDSGITNMFGASPYLYLGSERIEHEFKYKEIPDEEAFEKVLEMADQAQGEMVNGVIKVLESKNIEPTIEQINRYLKTYSSKVLQNYMLLF